MLNDIMNKHRSDKGTEHGSKHSYCDFYERYLGKFCTDPVSLLEIGINDGASIRAWQEYFPNGTILGVDLEDRSHLESERVKTLICDQSSELELEELSKSLKKTFFDIIIDDGSHHMRDQQISLSILSRHLKPGGYYIIEDLHTSEGVHGSNLYGRPLEILYQRENTTLFFLRNAFKSWYLPEKASKYLQKNLELLEIFEEVNILVPSCFGGKSITAILQKK